jgi:hypothetical protein
MIDKFTYWGLNFVGKGARLGQIACNIVDLTLGLYHFLTLLEAPIKSHHQVSNEEPFIN